MDDPPELGRTPLLALIQLAPSVESFPLLWVGKQMLSLFCYVTCMPKGGGGGDKLEQED